MPGIIWYPGMERKGSGFSKAADQQRQEGNCKNKGCGGNVQFRNRKGSIHFPDNPYS